MELDNICYKSPLLEQVILKLDFTVPLQELGNNILDTKIVNSVSKYFPIPELALEIKSETVQFTFGEGTPNNNTHTHSKFYQHSFHGQDREKTLTISPVTVFQVFKLYKSFEEFYSSFESILAPLMELHPNARISRIGIRYINVIEPHNVKKSPLEWTGYINSKLLVKTSFNSYSDRISRVFNVIEYNFDEMKIKFQYGVANPDFPAIVKKKQFVLDFDASVTGIYEVQDVKSIVNEAHKKIQTLFEDSIEDKTRKLMNNE